jgi:phage terminase Nu1 subunit (DNA packaging protein)
MLPVEKKADCRKKRKKRARRRSGRERVRKVWVGWWVVETEAEVEAGVVEVIVMPLGAEEAGFEVEGGRVSYVWMACSSRTQERRVAQKLKKKRPSYEMVRMTNEGENVRNIIISRWR